LHSIAPQQNPHFVQQFHIAPAKLLAFFAVHISQS